MKKVSERRSQKRAHDWEEVKEHNNEFETYLELDSRITGKQDRPEAQ